jgi:transcriptional regulator with XRE-family HTH domain
MVERKGNKHDALSYVLFLHPSIIAALFWPCMPEQEQPMPTVEAIFEPCIQECNLSFVLVGERLRELRRARKLSSRDLQKVSGISRFQTAGIERGHGIPDAKMLRRYARALKVPISALLYDGAPPQPDGEHIRRLSTFAKVFSSLSRSEWNLLRSIALRMRRKDVPAAVYGASAEA